MQRLLILALGCISFSASAQTPPEYVLKLSPQELQILGDALAAKQREIATLAVTLKAQIDAQDAAAKKVDEPGDKK
jgi:hypothetical protein